MLSGYDDSYRVFSNNVSAPWVDSNNKIVIDPNIMKWVDQTKTFTDKGYNNKTSLWDTTWASDQGPKGKVFGFFYSTWGINFTLLGNSLAETSSRKVVKKKLEMVFMVIMQYVRDHRVTTGVVHGSVQQQEQIIQTLLKKL